MSADAAARTALLQAAIRRGMPVAQAVGMTAPRPIDRAPEPARGTEAQAIRPVGRAAWLAALWSDDPAERRLTHDLWREWVEGDQ